jgi:hypothetical protein
MVEVVDLPDGRENRAPASEHRRPGAQTCSISKAWCDFIELSGSGISSAESTPAADWQRNSATDHNKKHVAIIIN